MYAVLSILICIGVTLYVLKRKDYKSPLLVFFGTWTVILFLAELHLFKIISASTLTYKYIFLGLFSFFLVYSLTIVLNRKYKVSYLENKNADSQENNVFVLMSNMLFVFFEKYKNNFWKSKKVKTLKKQTYELRYKLLHICGLICIIYFTIHVLDVVQVLISGGSLDTIRLMAQNPNSVLNERSQIENAIRILFVLPFSFALEPLAAIDFWMGKRDKKLLFITLTIIALRILTDAGRTPVVNFFIYMLLGYFFSKENNRITEKTKSRFEDIKQVVFSILTQKNNKISIKKILTKNEKIIISVSLVSIFILIISTLSRFGIKDFTSTLYYYFSIEPHMFDTWSKNTNSLHIVGYGMASFNGFFFTVFYLLKNIFHIPFPEYFQHLYDLILKTNSHWIAISSDGRSANAYVTLFWFFYTDGRLLGVIIGMMVYSYIMAKCYMSAIMNRSIKSVSIYVFLYQGLMFSFIRFPFVNLYYSLALLILVVVSFRSTSEK